jgi:hypothetical protein
VNVAWLGMNIETNVRGGENGGRKLTHDFVVLDFQSKPAAVSGANGIVAEFPAPTLGQDRPGAIAAWLSADDGSILQAAGGSLR